MTGGQLGVKLSVKSEYIDTTEVYDSNLGSWALSGAKLTQSMRALGAANVDGRVLIFGIIVFYLSYPECTEILL